MEATWPFCVRSVSREKESAQYGEAHQRCEQTAQKKNAGIDNHEPYEPREQGKNAGQGFITPFTIIWIETQRLTALSRPRDALFKLSKNAVSTRSIHLT